MSHRDITSVLPSLCALKAALSTPLTYALDRLALGQHEQRLWHAALEDLIEFRDGGREDRFFDVSFSDLQSDPIAAVETLYRQLGDDLPADARDQMAAWWQENSADRQQGARPDPADFGLDPATLRREFSFYDSRFAH